MIEGTSRALGTLFGSLAPFLVAVLVWIAAAPRSEFLSIGEGRGLRLSDAGADGSSQLLMLVILLGFAAVCSVLVLWGRMHSLRRPRGVLVLALVPGLACAAVAASATRLARFLVSPPSDAPYGDVVSQAPAVGALFFDRMVFGSSGPSWDLLPPGAGWLVWGAMIALFTVAVLAHFSYSPDLVDDDCSPDLEDVSHSPGPVGAESRTDQ